MAALEWVKKHLLIILTVVGVSIGLTLGFTLRLADLSSDAVDLISFPGEILMRALKMLILPLMASSLIVGVTSLDMKTSSHMGVRTILYFLVSALCSIVLGIILVFIMQPGSNDLKDELKTETTGVPIRTVDAFLDTFRNMLPDNIAQAMFQHTSTYYEWQNVTKRKLHYAPIPEGYTQNTSMADLVNMTNVKGAESGRVVGNQTRLIVVYSEMVKVRGLKMGMGMNVLGIIVFSVAFSITLTTMGSKAVLMVDFFTIVHELIMKIMLVMIWYSPFGIIFLIAGNIAGMKNVSEAASHLGMFVACYCLAVGIHIFLVLPAIYFAVCRSNPYFIIKGVVQAILTALGTASSAATLPITFQCTEEELRLDRRVTRFLLPLAVTVNMNGLDLYFIISPIFIAQMNHISLSFGEIISLSVTALFGAIGSAGVPGGGLITLLMVLSSANLPTEDMALLIGIDWFIDRFTTVANVIGDCFGAAIVARLSEQDLSEIDKQPDMTELLAEMKRRNKEQREKEAARQREKMEQMEREEKEQGDTAPLEEQNARPVAAETTGELATVVTTGGPATGQIPGDLATAETTGDLATVVTTGGPATGQIPGDLATGQTAGDLATVVTTGGPATAQVPGGLATGQIPGDLATGQIPGDLATVVTTGGPATAQIPGGLATGQIPGDLATVVTTGGPATAQIPGGLATGQIPGDLATGQIPGGLATGQIPGGLATAQIPGDLATRQIPGGLATAQIPGGLATAQIPGGLATGQIPGGLATGQIPAQIPGGVATGQIPGGLATGQFPGGLATAQIPGGLTTGQIPGGLATPGVPATSQIPGGLATEQIPAQIPGDVATGQIPGGLATAQIPGGLTTGQFPGGLATPGVPATSQIPGGLATGQIPGGLATPGVPATSQIPGGLATGQIPGGLATPSVPATSQIPGGLATGQIPGGLATPGVPAIAQIPGGVATGQFPGGLATVVTTGEPTTGLTTGIATQPTAVQTASAPTVVQNTVPPEQTRKDQ